jgi:hypothetical protein
MLKDKGRQCVVKCYKSTYLCLLHTYKQTVYRNALTGTTKYCNMSVTELVTGRKRIYFTNYHNFEDC